MRAEEACELLKRQVDTWKQRARDATAAQRLEQMTEAARAAGAAASPRTAFAAAAAARKGGGELAGGWNDRPLPSDEAQDGGRPPSTHRDRDSAAQCRRLEAEAAHWRGAAAQEVFIFTRTRTRILNPNLTLIVTAMPQPGVPTARLSAGSLDQRRLHRAAG